MVTFENDNERKRLPSGKLFLFYLKDVAEYALDVLQNGR